MPWPRLAIDDVEVRQQHGRQIRRSLVGLLVGAAVFWGLLLVPPTLVLWCMREFSDGTPGLVMSVDPRRDTVVVSYVAHDGPATAMMPVSDPSAYDEGDHVRVVLAGEDEQPWTLDREPLRLMSMTEAKLFGGLVLLTLLVGASELAVTARSRRRSLASAWRRVTGESWIYGSRAFAYLPDVDDGSYWKLSEPFSTSGRFAADLAGDGSRRVVLRNAGSTQLVLGRRCGPRTGDCHRPTQSSVEPPGDRFVVAFSDGFAPAEEQSGHRRPSHREVTRIHQKFGG